MNAPPKSVTNIYVNTAAVMISLACLAWILRYAGNLGTMQVVLLVCAAYSLPIVVLEGVFLKPFRKVLEFNSVRPFMPYRVSIKLLGLLLTCGLVILVYWLFPEYHGTFYNRYYALLRTLAPWFFGLALPYFLLVDRYSKEPKDGYWYLGNALLLNWDEVNWRGIGQHLLGWLVKLYFLPLMFIYLSDKIIFLRAFDFSEVFYNFRSFYDFSFEILFYIDLLIVTVGYMYTFKLTDSHIRTTESTFLGWGVALLCYQPFWSWVSAQYINYNTGRQWGDWLWEYPVLYNTWGTMILVLIAIYVWASIPFGLRFSNLTHRGVLTNGPYRYCKHPAYVSKNLSWWFISIPFLVSSSVGESVRCTLMLLLLNFIYFIRARTEERHLSWDPDYVAYAAYIEDHGILRWVGRVFPLLKFKPGQLFNS